jgi:hypothetical protein
VQNTVDTAVGNAVDYILTQVFDNIVQGVATVSSATCGTTGPDVVPATAQATCTVGGEFQGKKGGGVGFADAHHRAHAPPGFFCSPPPLLTHPPRPIRTHTHTSIQTHNVPATTTTVTYTCPSNTIPTGVGCNDQNLVVVDGSTPGVQLQTAQCIYPSNNVVEVIMTVTCMPSYATAPPPLAKGKPAAGAKVAAYVSGKVAANQKALLAGWKIAATKKP